jgi:hypothetical protein
LQEYGVRKVNGMKRREFLKVLLCSAVLSLFGKKTYAEKKPEKHLKEAMFWRRVD